MISRLILYLRKAADEPSSVWTYGTTGSIRFAPQTIGGTECVSDINTPSRTESAKLSHREIGGAEYSGDIELKDIELDGREGLSDGYN